jgi:hypothetical protein
MPNRIGSKIDISLDDLLDAVEMLLKDRNIIRTEEKLQTVDFHYDKNNDVQSLTVHI